MGKTSQELWQERTLRWKYFYYNRVIDRYDNRETFPDCPPTRAEALEAVDWIVANSPRINWNLERPHEYEA